MSNAAYLLYRQVGCKKHPYYKMWRSMLDRCHNPWYHVYPGYGGRGITVCKEWWSFPQFLKDMGERPENYTIERRENDKGYYKDNCYWAPWSTQAQNRRSTKLTAADAIQICLRARFESQDNLAKCYEVSQATISAVVLGKRWSNVTKEVRCV